MGRMQGKVALITGAGNGQGRSHAIRLAEEGASIIGIDLREDGLLETEEGVQRVGGEMIGVVADVREQSALDLAVDRGLSKFGFVDAVIANAGVLSIGGILDMPLAQWQETIDVNLTGVWQTLKAVVPVMVRRDQGGSIVIISSTAGLKPNGGTVHYAATKHALIGLARGLAKEVGQFSIRVNAILPTVVPTGMIDVDYLLARVEPGAAGSDDRKVESSLRSLHVLPVPWVEPVDVSNAVLWLTSDEGRFVTGILLPVDAGYLIK